MNCFRILIKQEREKKKSLNVVGNRPLNQVFHEGEVKRRFRTKKKAKSKLKIIHTYNTPKDQQKTNLKYTYEVYTMHTLIRIDYTMVCTKMVIRIM